MLTLAHAWSRRQKWFIVASAVVALGLFATLIYTNERYHRGPTDAVFVGLWEMQGVCMDCTFYYQLQPDHNVLGYGESRDLAPGSGRWYAGGELLVIHYDSGEEARSLVMRIVDITPDVIRLRREGEEVRMVRVTSASPKASNQAMQRTRTAPRLSFLVASDLPLRRSGAPVLVADLGSR